ncbi:flagellar assembly protein FliW [Iocasia frigidifontis]|uniref:Flagellar assembly factor FliW n=1 Tax=Iocasia fonsfrigidae TaxID=2682810 RepID=A0A8A7KGC4_9FIRM|nr:flagellar assembly protein FliW [Iocasia fonsfrigidae]QTL98758.1 flagellar assembly protein FliW [Iocasia fonsfrigidae]
MKLKCKNNYSLRNGSEEVITFFQGIPGFNDQKEFVFLCSKDKGPFIVMQSVEEENLAFITINPWEVLGDYRFEISDLVKERLAIKSLEDILVLAICNIRGRLMNMTVNLAAPIVINYKKRLGKQVVLENTDYQVRHPVFSVQSKLGVQKCLF